MIIRVRVYTVYGEYWRLTAFYILVRILIRVFINVEQSDFD